MNDSWAIKLAKTEYREGFSSGDTARVLSVFAAGFIDMSAGQPGFYGPEARVISAADSTPYSPLITCECS